MDKYKAEAERVQAVLATEQVGAAVFRASRQHQVYFRCDFIKRVPQTGRQGRRPVGRQMIPMVFPRVPGLRWRLFLLLGPDEIGFGYFSVSMQLPKMHRYANFQSCSAMTQTLPMAAHPP